MKDFFEKLGKWKLLLPAILLLLGLLTRFAFFGSPSEVVFDEVYFGQFVSSYYSGDYFFDIHPPLGKLIIAGASYIGGWHPGQGFEKIGEEAPAGSFDSLRFLPALAGALLPLVLFFLCLELGFSRKASFVAGLLAVFENSLLVQSRFMFLDSFLILFGFLGLLFYLLARRKESFAFMIAAALSLGCALSVKWTGASFLGLVLLLEAWHIIRERKWRTGLRTLAVFLVLPAVLYFLFFTIHFSLLYHSGPGNEFMTPAFKKSLIGTQEYEKDIAPLSLWGKFTELNAEMYRSNRDLKAKHPYSSKWYTWPFELRTVYYWHKTVGEKELNIYYLGNPFIYYVSFLAILALFLKTITSGRALSARKKTAIFLLIGYVANFIPFAFIGRVMFLYHYETALLFAILALCFLVETFDEKIQDKVWIALVSIAILFFLYFAPFTYGQPLTAAQRDAHFWLESWR